MLQLAEYRHLVDLDVETTTPEPLAPQDVVDAQLALLAHLVDELPPHPHLPSRQDLLDLSFAHRQRLLDALVTVRDPQELSPLPRALLEQADALARLRNDRNPDPFVPVSRIPTIAEALFPSTTAPADVLPPSFARIKFTRGDFTRLDSTTASSPHDTLALVNPANVRMLGCFKPTHKCADNVIHAAAGPSLRAECAKVMHARDWVDVETAEDVIVTHGGALRAQYVLHVAGPQLARKGAQPSELQVRQLETVYQRCLDLAEELGTISTVAFPCISTGLFFFPGDLAARIALRVVSTWLDTHPSSTLKNVVFVLFSQADTDNYLAALAAVFPSVPAPPAPLPVVRTVPQHVKRWIDEADSVIIHAGAGLSADAVSEAVGLPLDYTSPALFAKLYPGLVEHTSLRCLYDTIGHDWDDPLVKWAFILSHGYNVQNWATPSSPSPVYATLLRYARSRPGGFTVLTSNADNLFPSSGFPSTHFHAPQGSYTEFQCLSPSCAAQNPPSARVGPSLPACTAAHSTPGALDPHTMRLPPDLAPSLIPRCPACGTTDVFFRVRGGPWFVEGPRTERLAHAERVAHLVERARARGTHVVVLELGAGFNTPGVVRLPGEALVASEAGRGGSVKLVRVNPRAADVGFEVEYPAAAGGSGGDDWERRDVAGLEMGALEFLRLVEPEGGWA
ncbi:hypothetical protein JCM3775_004532 [Rhodotorula graminis]|uniref:ADP-ribose 1''-phosphate phosphatase n=1 Tax=Rhodotorula graminis (strain WP1) TaxID=578459 RepID=A0A194S4Q5_RHOGW|nr:uncharacterized protein RHOBADRAFT_53533 [Rhodotorula graminis WP1]KPV75567.1 hypothetical protein RHOBADRAFT_53533 [Rhodotorula graminis WP1]